MNSKYEDLAEEAMVHVPGAKGLHTRAFSLERYTELVIRECKRVMVDQDGYYGEWLGDVLEKHFGVNND